MTESEIQQLLQNQTGSSTSIPDTSNILSSVLEPLMPLLTIALIVGAVLSVVVVIFFIINIVQKQRQHAAIMRIDRNLQTIVDSQNQSATTPPRDVTPNAATDTVSSSAS